MSRLPAIFSTTSSANTRSAAVSGANSLIQNKGGISPAVPSSSFSTSDPSPPSSSSSHDPHSRPRGASDVSRGGPVPLSNSCPDPSSDLRDLRSSSGPSSSSSSSSSFSGAARPSQPVAPSSGRAPPPQKQMRPSTRCACLDCDREASAGFRHCNRACATQQCHHPAASLSSSLRDPIPPSSSLPSDDLARTQMLLSRALKPTVDFFRYSRGVMPPRIEFYERSQAFYEFTNFHEEEPILLDGKEWRTVEHYFQAQKFFPDHPHMIEEVRHLRSSREAFNYVREPRNAACVRKDWHTGTVKIDVMHKAVFAKFSQSEKLKAILLATQDAELIEHTTNDNFWGDGGGGGKGENQLGQLLVRVRTELSQPLPPYSSL